MAGDEGKEKTELTEEQKAAAEYDAAWEEAGKQDQGKKKTDTVEETADKDKTDEGLPPEEGALKTDDTDKQPVSKDHGDIASTEKALNDTKSALTRVQQENADLKRLLEEQKKGKATQEQVDAQKKATEDATAKMKEMAGAAAEDYPELKPLFDTFIETATKLTEEVTSLKKTAVESDETRKHREALNEFNARVKPKVLEEHPDYDAIIGLNPDGTIDRARYDEYVNWANGQRPSLRTAAVDSGDPEDIKWALREFKKFKGSPEAQKLKEKQEKDKKEKIENAQTLRGGSTSFPTRAGGKEKDPNDYDAGWEEAGSILERKGVK